MSAKILQFKPRRREIDMHAELERAMDDPKPINISWRCLGYLAAAARANNVSEYDLINDLITQHLGQEPRKGIK